MGASAHGGARHDRRAAHIERWLANLRLGVVVFAIVEVGVLQQPLPVGLPDGGVGAHRRLRRRRDRSLLPRARAPTSPRSDLSASVRSLCDTAVICGYGTVFSYEYGNQTRWAADLRRGRGRAPLRASRGGVALRCCSAASSGSTSGGARRVRAARVQLGPRHVPDRRPAADRPDRRLRSSAGSTSRRGAARERAAEAERLRDALGRRVDVLEAANRCARALGSSLEIEQAFGAFIREVRGLVPFDRTAIVLVEGDGARTIASAGRGANEVFPPGTVAARCAARCSTACSPARSSSGATSRDPRTPRTKRSLALGLRSELVAPLLARRPADRDDLALARRGRRVHAGRGRARLAARPPRRDRGAEHPRLRGRAADGRGAAPALGAARRLRLARLARAAQPDGGRDRRRAHAAGPLARAQLRTSARRSSR